MPTSFQGSYDTYKIDKLCFSVITVLRDERDQVKDLMTTKSCMKDKLYSTFELDNVAGDIKDAI